MKYLLSLFILVMITSCTKFGKNVTLKGRVMNPVTGEGIEGQTFIDNFELDVKRGKVTNADFYAVPYGSLTLNVKNTSCFNSSDNVKIYFDSGPYDSRTFNPGMITSLDGCIDIPGTPVKSSMGYKYFHWEVTKNAVTTTYYDTVFVNESQTTVLNVNY